MLVGAPTVSLRLGEHEDTAVCMRGQTWWEVPRLPMFGVRVIVPKGRELEAPTHESMYGLHQPR
jgi:hypothetical protein